MLEIRRMRNIHRRPEATRGSTTHAKLINYDYPLRRPPPNPDFSLVHRRNRKRLIRRVVCARPPGISGSKTAGRGLPRGYVTEVDQIGGREAPGARERRDGPIGATIGGARRPGAGRRGQRLYGHPPSVKAAD